MRLKQYDSGDALSVYSSLGFEVINTNEHMIYLYHRHIYEEVIIDKKPLISYQIIEKTLSNIDIDDWVFDSLYESQIKNK